MKREVYNLVIENRPNEFLPIDINILLNNQSKKDYSYIESIDQFTMNHTEDEVRKMIKQNNLVPLSAVNKKMHIINEHRYRFEVVFKNMNFSIEDFLKTNLDNKIIMNKFINIYQKYSKNELDNLKNAINGKNIMMILQIVSNLSYIDIRNICLYLYHLN